MPPNRSRSQQRRQREPHSNVRSSGLLSGRPIFLAARQPTLQVALAFAKAASSAHPTGSPESLSVRIHGIACCLVCALWQGRSLPPVAVSLAGEKMILIGQR
jgi:hypothetical protein